MGLNLLDAQGAGGAVGGDQRMMQGEGDRPVGRIQSGRHIKGDRGGGEQVRLRSGDVEVSHRGVQIGLAGVAFEVCGEGSDAGAGGFQRMRC